MTLYRLDNVSEWAYALTGLLDLGVLVPVEEPVYRLARPEERTHLAAELYWVVEIGGDDE